ncbi:hypothetical protein Tco_1512928 [Tanacetum coccineum]
MSVSAAEQDRVWKKILKKKGLSLDTPLSTEGCFEWPPKNTDGRVLRQAAGYSSRGRAGQPSAAPGGSKV